MKIRFPSGKLTEATYVRHLRTLTGSDPGRGQYSCNTDVDLYRTQEGRLVVATSPDLERPGDPRGRRQHAC
jgi:hypothetical protein